MFVEKSVCIHPSLLSPNLRDFLLKTAKETWEGKCTKSDGYITKILSYKILSNKISPATSGIIFNLQLNINVYKPKKDDIAEGIVKHTTIHGVFVNIENLFNVLIPTSSIPEYSFDKSSNTFISKDKSIGPGNCLKTKIVAIKFEKERFNCIGELVSS